MALAIEHPLEDPASDRNESLYTIDVILTILFSIEALIKIISFGLLRNGKFSYLLEPWNILDFSIVVLSIVSLSFKVDWNFIRVLRSSRILRPLRLIQHADSLKIAIASLAKAIPEILRLYVVLSFVTFLIAILMTNLLSGKLFYCDLDHTMLTFPQI